MTVWKRLGAAPAGAAIWLALMGCADPRVKDPMGPREFIAASAASLKNIPDPKGPTIERLAELGVLYEPRGPGGACGIDPFIHGPQDHCHPQHQLYADIKVRLDAILAKDDESMSPAEAERVALAAFWCAAYTHVRRVDSIEAWPTKGPWSDRMLTLTQRENLAVDRTHEKRSIAVINGLGMTHNRLIHIIRWVDHGMTIERFHGLKDGDHL